MNLPNPVDRKADPYTCPICSTEFPSWATWTRNDRDHYLQTHRPVWARHTATAGENVPTNEYDNVEGPDRRPSTGRQTSHTPTKASEKQVEFLIRLSTERGLVDTPELRTVYANLTKTQASKAIDALMNTPKTTTTAATTETTPTIRRNKFEGICSSCGRNVAAETGLLTKTNDKWTVRHEGDCPQVETQTTVSIDVDVPDGYYAIESSGQNDLAFYAVTHSDRYGISVKMVVGGHVDTFVRRNAVAGIVERIAADVDGAAKRYADEIGNCYRCNRTLTDETSRALGIGPTCRNKS